MSFVDFRLGARNFRLTDEMVCYAGIRLPALDAMHATAVLRAALASGTPILATQVRHAFAGIDGGRAGSPAIPPALLADRLGQLVRQRRMTLYDSGPDVVMLKRIDGSVPRLGNAPSGLVEKVTRVVQGLEDVPPGAIGDAGAAAFRQFVDAMTTMPALVGTMVFVFVAWVASQATGVAGLVIDAVLLGIAIASIGMQAFDWFGKLGALVGKISAAKSDEDYRACSVMLARLIVEIGVAAFITLLTRAAGKKISKVVGDKQAELRTAAERPVAPAKRQTGTTVLGHNPEYQALANKGGDRYFDIPTDQWDRITKGMSKQDIFTKFNQPFIDRTIARGDNIILSNPVTKVKPGSYFEMELKYLFSKGYTPSADGMSLIRPGGL